MPTPPAPLLTQLNSAMLLIIAPWRLHAAATQLSVRCAFWLFIPSTSLVLGVAGGGLLAAVAEPYSSTPSYLLSGLDAGLKFAALLCIPIGLIALFLSADFPRRGPRNRAKLCAFFLIPVTLLLPLSAWSLCIAFIQMRPTGFNITTPKPAWIHSPILDIACLGGLPLIAAATYANLRAAFTRFRSLPAADNTQTCPTCRYDLRGLPQNSPCPECGTPPQTTD